MADYNIGTAVRVTAAFTDVAGAPGDPTGVVFKVRTPAGIETEYVFGVDVAVVKTGVGAYYFDIYLTTHGTYFYRWVGSGSIIKGFEGSLKVKRSYFEDPL